MPEELHSPLQLLHEADTAEEVLSLSYCTNLGFWERFALGPARSLGAKVTVVGDAGMVAADPDSVRYAGLTYIDGRAACASGGAFHPKLLVIAGEKKAIVAIGSGNTTVAGWHENAELWTVLHGDVAGAPSVFGELADWLLDLPHHIEFSWGVAEALCRVATCLRRFPLMPSEHRLVSSTSVPIIDALPQETVQRLIVSAPFYDPGSFALRALIERLKPEQAAVAIQTQQANFDGASLASALSKVQGSSVEEIADSRYHHGKLIEWTARGERWALTGSPNLSKSALMSTLADIGNCELALVSRIESSLQPECREAPATSWQAKSYVRQQQSTSRGVVLLGAILSANGLRLSVVAEDVELTCEALVDDAWIQLGKLEPAAPNGFVVRVEHAADGAPIRVRSEHDVSNTVFITNPQSALRPRVIHTGSVRADHRAVFADPKLAEAWIKDLAQLKGYLRQEANMRSSVAGSSAPSPQPMSSRRYESWNEYLDLCAGCIGESFISFGLALPSLSDDRAMPIDLDGELTPDLDSDETEDSDDQLANAEPDERDREIPDLSAMDKRRRERYRRWFEELRKLSPGLAAIGQMVALRLALRAHAGALWDDPQQAAQCVASIASDLAGNVEQAGDARASAANLAAIGIAATRLVVGTTDEWTAARPAYERALKSAPDLIEYLDERILDSYAAELVPHLGAHVSAQMVLRHVKELGDDDPLASLVTTLYERYKLDAEVSGGVIDLCDAYSGRPQDELIRAVGCAPARGSIAARARSTEGYTMTVVWNKPDLIIVRDKPRLAVRRYRLRGEPNFSSGSRTFAGINPEVWVSPTMPPDDVLVILRHFGIAPEARDS